MPRQIPIFALLGALLGTAAPAQDPPPATDVFLASLEVTSAGVEIGDPVNVTRRDGYDNQPCFLPDGKRLVYTRIDDGQADVWVYDLAAKSSRPLVETADTSEYSPTPIPGEDAISVVRVEADGTQRLWRFPLDGKAPDLLLPDIRPVGYHAWLSGTELVLFVLGEPHLLQAATRGPGEGRTLARDVGRALHRVPGTALASFVHKEGDGGWQIQQVDPSSGDMKLLVPTRGEREDFTWLPNGHLLAGDGGALYTAPPGGDWVRAADFSDDGITDVTRIAVHPGGTWVAFVAVASK